MQHRMFRFHGFLFRWRTLVSEELLAFVLALVIFIAPLSAVPMRFSDRSLFMQSTEPGVTTSYTISFQYMTPVTPVGSVEMLFCIDPIPYMPCDVPPGLDVANAVMSEQTGETGFSITQATTNKLVISRSPTAIDTQLGLSSYTFEGIQNPTVTKPSFSIRMKSLESTNATGPHIDFGSIKGQATQSVELQTQVPPMLIFCAAEVVNDNCESTNESYFEDMGQLNTSSTLTAKSEMAVGTNASGGFVIYAIGTPPAAATNVINSPSTPVESRPGTNQFGINLVENPQLGVGSDPEGIWANALPSPDYAQPDKFKYTSGDVVAYSPNVSLMKKFTVSYILNTSPSLRAGVYTTTINFVASGRF